MSSWHTYCARKDGHGVVAPAKNGDFGRSPYWYPATIDAWVKTRPGRGVGGGRPWHKEASS
jgi:hypothetical protein